LVVVLVFALCHVALCLDHETALRKRLLRQRASKCPTMEDIRVAVVAEVANPGSAGGLPWRVFAGYLVDDRNHEGGAMAPEMAAFWPAYLKLKAEAAKALAAANNNANDAQYGNIVHHFAYDLWAKFLKVDTPLQINVGHEEFVALAAKFDTNAANKEQNHNHAADSTAFDTAFVLYGRLMGIRLNDFTSKISKPKNIENRDATGRFISSNWVPAGGSPPDWATWLSQMVACTL